VSFLLANFRSTVTMTDLHQTTPSMSSDNREKSDYAAQQLPISPVTSDSIHGVEYKDGTRLHRGLKARHITMIAIGGAIGEYELEKKKSWQDVGVTTDRYWSDHWNWLSFGASWTRLNLHLVHHRRIPCIPGHVCSRRNGNLASTFVWLHWVRREIL